MNLKKMILEKRLGISKIKTPEQAEKAYLNAPKNSTVQKAILLKWILFCKTRQQVQTAYSYSISDSKIKVIAENKWNLLSLKEILKAKTREQTEEACENAPFGSEAKKAGRDKWNKFSMKEVEAAQTYEQAENAFKNAPYDSTSATAALDKMKEFSKKFIDSPLLSSHGYSFDKNEIMKKQADIMEEFSKLCKK